VTRPQTGRLASRSALWGNRDFTKFWFGETLSLFGAQITTLALPLTAVTEFGAGPKELGLLGFATWCPYVVFALLFGVWVDRTRRRPMMIWANVVRMVLIGLVPLLAALDRLEIVSLVLITAGVGVASVLFDVSWMSYVPTLVRGPDNLVEANGKLGATAAAATSAGPGLGGLLVTALTAPVAMVVDAVSYLVSVVTLVLIRVQEPPPKAGTTRRRLIPELLEGLRWVAGNRYLREIALFGCLCNFLTIASSTLYLLYALQVKGLRPDLIGLVLSLGAVGGVAGAALSGRVLAKLGVGRTYVVSMSMTFLGLVLVPVADGPRPLVVVLFVLAYFVAYLGISVANVVIVSLRQTVTPHSLLGRMNAAMRTLLYAGAALGAAVAGLLGDTLGLRGGLWLIAAGAGAMIVTVLLSSVGRLREMPPAAE
jgi:MFS family permease